MKTMIVLILVKDHNLVPLGICIPGLGPFEQQTAKVSSNVLVTRANAIVQRYFQQDRQILDTGNETERERMTSST
jgi:hypothetical protein